MTTPIVPPDLDQVRGMLRPRMADIPTILADWPHGEGPLADVPLLDPGLVAPRAFTELAGTVRVATAGASHVTVAGLLEIGGGGGLLVTAIAVSPHDLAGHDEEAARAALATAGARSDGVLVEVVALLAPIDPDGGPVGGVGIVRPLLFAQPAAFPHADDTMTHSPEVVQAARDAAAQDHELISDLGARPFTPMPADLARIWSPMFAVARSATVGLAARAAGH